MPQAVIICCYFGKLPHYFNYFLQSVEENSRLDFIIFNDCVNEEIKYKNVFIVPLSRRYFDKLASEKTGVEINLKNAYKLCDFKPAYGKIFEDYLNKYEFWGYGDIDIIFGEVEKFLTPEIFLNHDVITTCEKWMSGHFTLLRNNSFFKELFKQSPSYKKVFVSEKYEQFDESCRRWDGELFTIEDLLQQGLLVSMFDVVKKFERARQLRLYVIKNIREYLDPINYFYNNRKFIDLNNGEDIFYYHFFYSRKSWRFFMPFYDSMQKQFFITPLGIISYEEKNNFIKYWWWICKRAKHCFKAILKSVKNQPLIISFKKLFGIYYK